MKFKEDYTKDLKETLRINEKNYLDHLDKIKEKYESLMQQKREDELKISELRLNLSSSEAKLSDFNNEMGKYVTMILIEYL